MDDPLQAITPQLTVNRLLELAPDAIEVLDQFGIDSCCGGSLSLQEAALQARLDPESMLRRLKDLFRE